MLARTADAIDSVASGGSSRWRSRVIPYFSLRGWPGAILIIISAALLRATMKLLGEQN
jgi:hypothetical protein